ncbi:hypothetical protein [Mycoplasma sp. 1654_15]|uniref:hypothetical protein n=1 Tax=Mycoplasma sp. 1654_15 TaxID=2725994 RepID=UPI001448AD63|nr:hypothetical protein [Mycoplasma sp. 1654_15]QJB71026.1 hypothetical protein HF996_00645 [Mycoplasma sp. 1654_15]
MKKWKLFLCSIISASASLATLISCDNNKKDINVFTDTGTKTIIDIEQEADFFTNNIQKTLYDNFNDYKKNYFLNLYWISYLYLKFENFEPGQRVNDELRYGADDKQIENINDSKKRHEERKKLEKQRDLNKKSFKLLAATEFQRRKTLKSVSEFKNTNPNVIKPILEDYLSRNFPDLQKTEFFNKYNLYYYIDNGAHVISEYFPNNENSSFYFDLVESEKKLYMFDSFPGYYPTIMPAIYRDPGAYVSIVAIEKSKNVVFAKDKRITAIMK